MKRTHNIIFCLFICIALSIPLVNMGGSKLGLWNIPDKSYLENRTYNALHKPTARELITGSYQDNFESRFSDQIPFRDEILLANARMQRACISIANTAFSFEAYPAFFGSQRSVCPNLQAVYQTPESADDFDFEAYESRLSDALSSLSDGQDDINWVIALPESSAISMVTPSHDLIANPLDYEKIARSIQSCLPENFTFVDLRTDDIDEYLRYYFRTDHHLQIEGAIESYRSIMKSLGKQPVEFEGQYLATDLPFYGANARPALITDYWDDLYDVSYQRSDFNLKVNGKKKSEAYLDKGYGNKIAANPTSRFESLYLYWFHKNAGIIEYENQSDADGTLLLISDSFSNNCGRFYAENFKRTYEIDPRHYEGNISELIEDSGADTVIVFLSQDSLDTPSIVEFLGEKR